ncbi:MAG: PAS domain S-box protein, partial [Mariprofundaceae bacterium]|nr:PAS domain S-box protein [Mariprofundaceae bacterium]
MTIVGQLAAADDQFFQSIVESIASAVFVFQGEKMCYVNASAQSISGYSQAELLSKPFWAVIHEDFRELVKQSGLSRQSGDDIPASYEVKILRKDGDIRWVNFRASMIELNGKPAVLGIGEDISERKQFEEAFQTIIKSIVISTGQGFFDVVASSLCEWLNADCAIISEIIENEGRVEALSMQLDGENIAGFGYNLSGSPCNNAIAKGYAVYPENICEIFPDDKEILEMQAEGYVGVSLKDKGGESIGILCVLSRHKLSLPAKTREMLEIIAAKAAVQIERKQDEEKASLLRQQLARQRTATMQLSTSTPQTLEAFLQEVCEVSAHTLKVERVSIWLLSEDRRTLRCLNLFELGETKHSAGRVLQSGDYPRYFAALTADMVVDAHDARSDPRTCEFTEGYLVALGITAMLDAPIRLEGKVVGVVCHEHTGDARKWTIDESGFSCGVAELVAQELINEKRKRSETLVKQTGDILEMIATGETASNIYDAIALMF